MQKKTFRQTHCQTRGNESHTMRNVLCEREREKKRFLRIWGNAWNILRKERGRIDKWRKAEGQVHFPQCRKQRKERKWAIAFYVSLSPRMTHTHSEKLIFRFSFTGSFFVSASLHIVTKRKERGGQYIPRGSFSKDNLRGSIERIGRAGEALALL